MARLLRVEFAGAIYHVSARGNERRLIFRDDRDRKRFLENLAQAQQLHQPRLYLVCLMPNHFHLLLETPAANLSAFMARLLTGYAIYFNRRHHRAGHLTQGRFKAQLVEGNDYLLKLSRYIHLNPVCGKKWMGVPVTERREQLREYGWSTYRSYAGLEARWSWIEYGPVQALVDELGASYQEYVESGLARDDEEFRALYHQARLSLGSESFAQEIKQAHRKSAASARRPEDIALRRVGRLRSSEEILETVASIFGISEAELLRRSRGSIGRAVAAWALIRHGGLTERGAAEILRMGSGSAVSQQLSKWREAVVIEPELQRLQSELERRLAPANF